MKTSTKIMKKEEEQIKKAMDEDKKNMQPLIFKIIQIIAANEFDIYGEVGANRPEQTNEINKQIQELFYEHDIYFGDRLRIFQNVMHVIEYIRNCVVEDTQLTFDLALAKKLGIEDVRFMKYRKMIELRDETNARSS